ncbi:UDP-3-O-acylglucosamine N-acyltransferase [Capnocytophaga canimorsus]|uniref:UDP-3-O-acylglucosamine N-acyltransferase n=1 Tax=Capnocytophaga canimorsus TaxID=28188 RepID=A0A0B7H1F9_9FLAO|nr:UDP-3-O-(3-hydroxymyristoyl)glucosamine N-acyltransferase [Capnocytophaga canimorsus]ATA76522.1 UDP-3-O-(3-hydroxymyristoyl)glucosamine N-acyltransferase [Capnocytophaga canimorsus]PJI77283.1 UDP-3-O-[3-hydroxymyristoyl] glucosamine N-acyltransferase [Capnocytophaga canimorsus]CEN33421.1 UDP-3-O-acylglucosamine N-acyltransferase [Capnocytophaga canimorsus]STA71680.1 UDP-3-O-(3-hydroxymyristoyl)glucosamine N-acyltransferase [Capnocytophaga canimorsus]
MKFTALQISNILNGQIVGDPDVQVHKLSKIEEGEEGSITFLANPKYKNFIYTTKASIAIVNKSFEPENEVQVTLIKVEDAYSAFSKLLEYYNQIKLNKSGIEQPVSISQTAQLGENVYVGAFTYIGDNVVIGDNVKIYPNTYIGDNVTIGDNTILFAGCKIYSETVIGKHCTLHAGVILGADGFGFAPVQEGFYNKVPQIGNVIIEDYVDIGAGSTIDRATLGSTIIRKGVKLDNQIQIAHNVEIGKNTVIAAQTGIAGSTKIGENCMIGGQVGIVGHLTIGNRVKIQAQSGVIRNVEDDEMLQGAPAIGYNDYNKSYVIFKKLPSLMKRFLDIEKKYLESK